MKKEFKGLKKRFGATWVNMFLGGLASYIIIRETETMQSLINELLKLEDI